ncbi:hypothetical protein SLS60_005330 [Paraconiothyrium brasiliense]|uniref:Uncharacterized protein n=1 Tax=Paraconiothyrium brasiliense TaxID=300254 RepID=A0ABR3RH16_9PLEO
MGRQSYEHSRLFRYKQPPSFTLIRVTYDDCLPILHDLATVDISIRSEAQGESFLRPEITLGAIEDCPLLLRLRHIELEVACKCDQKRIGHASERIGKLAHAWEILKTIDLVFFDECTGSSTDPKDPVLEASTIPVLKPAGALNVACPLASVGTSRPKESWSRHSEKDPQKSIIMEAAAAVVSFVGLAAPVAQGLKFLYDFTTDMKDCPKEIREMKTDLELVEALITQVIQQCNERDVRLRESADLARAIGHAQESVEDLKKELTAYVADGKRKRFRFAAKISQTQRLRASLDRTRTIMLDFKNQLQR